MAIQRYSKQREHILSYLNSVTSHPNAETVYFEVRKKIPTISLGTVYRNLNQLADNGIILRLITNSGTEHFDATVKPHCHAICASCGRIDDIKEDIKLDLDERVGKITGYKDLSHKLHFYGICPKCGEKGNLL